jgi:hypothetical protein
MSKLWVAVVVLALGHLALVIPAMQGAEVGVAITADEASTIHGACDGYTPVPATACGAPCIFKGRGVDPDTPGGIIYVVHIAYLECGCGYNGPHNAYGCS